MEKRELPLEVQAQYQQLSEIQNSGQSVGEAELVLIIALKRALLTYEEDFIAASADLAADEKALAKLQGGELTLH